MTTFSPFNPGSKVRRRMDDAEKEARMHEMLARGEKQGRILRTLGISSWTMQKWLDKKRRGETVASGNVAGPCYARGYRLGWGGQRRTYG